MKKQRKTKTSNGGSPNPATVKVMGPAQLVEAVVDHLKTDFLAVQTSDFMPNDRGPGVHVFIRVWGLKE